MSKVRKGVLTPQQEEQLDSLIKLDGIMEALDGPAIKLADNKGIEALKSKIPEDYLPVVYEIVDAIFLALPTVKK
jgi:hypothetical protein